YATTIVNRGIAYEQMGNIELACADLRAGEPIYRAFGQIERADQMQAAIEQVCNSTPVPTLPPISRGGTQRGAVEIGSSDEWTFEGRAGEVITIRVNADAPANDAEDRAGLFETLVRIYTPDGELLAEADDLQAGVITDSELHELTLPVDGTYRIEVLGWDNRTGGAYTLTIKSDAAP
ncbi:MAG: hypothetical protein SGI73_13655, partial [Chloroflexota bacterium]|nr:hypothetical protein [Chloroflexota bacterium]